VISTSSYRKPAATSAKSKIICGLFSVIFLWTFVGTIDGPSVTVGSGYFVYRTPNVLDFGHGEQPTPFWTRLFSEEPRPVHASFLLFDFKQNLRRWPNVAGDISRSPPSFQTA
jgi:hypothetical protein